MFIGPRLLFILPVAALAALNPLAGETAQVITDPYAGASYSGHAEPDVIGKAEFFDIEQIRFTELTRQAITVELWFNYHAGDQWLAPFRILNPTCDLASAYCVELTVGDLLFDVGETYRWGAPLVDHDGLAASTLYEYAPGGYITSNQKMAGERLAYGTDRPVLIDPSAVDWTRQPGAALSGGPLYEMAGTGAYEVKTTLRFATGGTSLWDTFLENGSLSVHFASAFCGNDVIDGLIHADMPEPDTYFLFGAGLLLAIGIGRRVERT